MNPAEHGIRAVLDFLDRPDRVLVDRETAGRLLERARYLEDRARRADDRVAVGLVGGTGVGKSTLINALAGSAISTATDLRPTTNRVVIYRHANNDFSLEDGEEIHDHGISALSRVSLVDFPDFDSVEPHHRRLLARHFARLDLVLWIADPSKYADLAFYDWLALSPQARENAVFVFNKIDDLERRYRARAAEVIDEMDRGFPGETGAPRGHRRPGGAAAVRPGGF